MRITLVFALGLLCLALTACPKSDTGDEGAAMPDTEMRKPDMSGAAGSASDAAAPAEGEAAANPCAPAENPCGANPCNPCAGGETPTPTPTTPGGEGENPCNPCAPAENPCGGGEAGGEAQPCNPCGGAEGGH